MIQLKDLPFPFEEPLYIRESFNIPLFQRNFRDRSRKRQFRILTE